MHQGSGMLLQAYEESMSSGVLEVDPHLSWDLTNPSIPEVEGTEPDIAVVR